MNLTDNLLTNLIEECSEVIKVCCKAQRFGVDHTNWREPDGPNNRQILIDELNDVMAVVRLLQQHDQLPEDLWDSAKQSVKMRKVMERMEQFAGESRNP